VSITVPPGSEIGLPRLKSSTIGGEAVGADDAPLAIDDEVVGDADAEPREQPSGSARPRLEQEQRRAAALEVRREPATSPAGSRVAARDDARDRSPADVAAQAASRLGPSFSVSSAATKRP
jgi:hypothetical protein